jgi:glycosyltransferase involved in cell wall biosynthesis
MPGSHNSSAPSKTDWLPDMSSNRQGLAIFYYGSFYPTSNGSHVRMTSMLDRLSSEFRDVTLYSYGNHPSCPWDARTEAAFRSRWPDVNLVIESHTAALRAFTRVKNLLVSLFPELASQVLRMGLPGSTPKFDVVKESSVCLIVNYAEGLAQLNGVDAGKCYVETHDVNFIKWSKLHLKSPVSLVPLRKMRGEIGALEASKGVISISPSETSLFKMMLRSAGVFYVPAWDVSKPGVDSGRRPAEFDLVFAASEFVMNVRGFISMLNDHGHWLAKYKIAVCGRVCEDPTLIDAVAKFQNIALLGFVDRVEDVYARSKAALAPVDGTGMKIKVASALAAGLPVFASAHCLEGLAAGYQGAVFEINQGVIEEILTDATKLQRASSAALQYDALLKTSGELRPLLETLHSILQ